MSNDSPNPPPEEPTRAADDSSQSAEHDLSPLQLLESQSYGRRSLVCDLIDTAVDLVFLSLMAFLFAKPLDDWMKSTGNWFDNSHFRRWIAMFLIVYLIHMVISSPISYYAGFVLEHRFKLSRLSLSQWVWRYIKRNALALVFGTVMILGLYALMRWTGHAWWYYAAGVFFLISIVLGQLAPVVLLPLFYKISRLDNDDLNARMARLAQGTGLKIDGVYRMEMSAETVKANAMLAGLGSTRRVLLGDTLLDEFTPDEIEVILAHEIGHHVNKHIPQLIVLGVLLSATGFWLCDMVLQARVAAVEANPPANIYEYMPVYVLPLFMLWTTLFSLCMQPLQNVVSRMFERQCDRYALQRTGLRAAYVSAFQKLARLNKDDPNPHPVEVVLFHSHPPISERLAMANDELDIAR